MINLSSRQLEDAFFTAQDQKLIDDLRIMRKMKETKESGAVTIAQDEKTSVVWGMPGEAVKLRCVDNVLPLDHIANKIITLLKDRH